MIADVDGPATIRHIWMTFPGAPPEQMRALYMEVFYDDMTEPSISVPCLDFFGATLGRPTAMNTALTAIQEGRGFNSFIPIAFGDHIRIEIVNASDRDMSFFYQLDYTLGADDDAGRLHVTFRRQNPTIAERRLRDRGRAARPGPLPRLCRRHSLHRPRRLVRRRRGEGLQGRRHRLPNHLRHRTRGLRRFRVGHGPACVVLCRLATRRSAGGREPGDVEPRLPRLLPLARARPDHVRARDEGDDSADRLRPVLARPGRPRAPNSRRAARSPATDSR